MISCSCFNILLNEAWFFPKLDVDPERPSPKVVHGGPIRPTVRSRFPDASSREAFLGRCRGAVDGLASAFEDNDDKGRKFAAAVERLSAGAQTDLNKEIKAAMLSYLESINALYVKLSTVAEVCQEAAEVIGVRKSGAVNPALNQSRVDAFKDCVEKANNELAGLKEDARSVVCLKRLQYLFDGNSGLGLLAQAEASLTCDLCAYAFCQ